MDDVLHSTRIENLSEQAFSDSLYSRYHSLPTPDDFISILPSPDLCRSEDDVVIYHVTPDYRYNGNISCSISSGSISKNNNNEKTEIEDEDEFDEFLLDAMQWL
mmetsp:Transcript_12094/g.11828  ORF Transcript_12094/g.11828 Transcript_12094/m.11828 type:complete len:104 (+) Transcript_12094:266-577(+)